MLSYYIVRDGVLHQFSTEDIAAGEQPTWIDMLDPTVEEIELMKTRYNIKVTRNNNAEAITLPSCYYEKKHEAYTTMNIVAVNNKITKLTYILSAKYFISVRCAEVPANFAYLSYVAQNNPEIITPANIYSYFMEARLMYLDASLEKIDLSVDAISQGIFYSSCEGQSQKNKINFRQYINSIGQNGHILSKNDESLISINQALSLIAETKEFNLTAIELEKINNLLIESTALAGKISFLSDKISFLLDICFGMIGVKQSEISKVLSIAALIFLPPTFITSAYGMNFTKIPLSNWEYGFQFTLVMIILSASLPYLFCKYKEWI